MILLISLGLTGSRRKDAATCSPKKNSASLVQDSRLSLIDLRHNMMASSTSSFLAVFFFLCCGGASVLSFWADGPVPEYVELLAPGAELYIEV